MEVRMISAKVTIINPKTKGEYIRYSRNSTLGDCIKVCLNDVDSSIPLRDLPNTYHIKVDLRFDGKKLFETDGWQGDKKDEL